ncbi:MAG TPA: SLC13 family permease [Candidatus Hydrogenedentes bacterium]|nr:SLC13 family permease [Candidatus Hydrogenedentota bacterium]HNT89046.1 SLC13 family permease [Candidatus Hydrogenedentota bacterium]
MNQHVLALGVFIVAYLLFVVLPRYRSLVAAVAGCVLVVTGGLSPREALVAVNWNVMGIFVGTLMVADVFIESRFPAWFAEFIVNRARNTAWAILFICMMTGVISAFVENVATVLVVAPVALSLSRKLRLDPRSILIAVAISSNLQGTATLIGDPPSMLLGGYAKMTFIDFFVYEGRPSIFFAVELGAAASFFVLFFIFRRYTQKVALQPVEEVRSWLPPVLLLVLIAALAMSSFFDTGFSFLAGGICMIFGVAMLLWQTRLRGAHTLASLRRLDWDTTFFLMGIFVIVEGLTTAGWIDVISGAFSRAAGEDVLLGYTGLILFAIFVSAFVDNVPFLAAMLPVAQNMAKSLDVAPSLLLFGLLIGASLGGNITPIGASANIVACGLSKQAGYPVTFREFARISVPFTIAAVAPAAILLWIVWR